MCVCVCVCVIKKKDYSTQSSQVVSNPSTNRARRGLTSLIGREVVLSSWYGRNQYSFLLFYFLLHSLKKEKKKESLLHTLTHSHTHTFFPFLCASVVIKLKIAFFHRWKGENSRENKKKHKRRRWHKQSTTRRHTMNKWTIKQISKHTDRHVCMCAYSLQRPHSEKRRCFSKEKLWFWSEYMILMVLFVATELNSPCYFFFSYGYLIVVCYWFCVIAYLLCFVLPFFFFSSFFFARSLVHRISAASPLSK